MHDDDITQMEHRLAELKRAINDPKTPPKVRESIRGVIESLQADLARARHSSNKAD